jgi:phage-related protein
MRNDLTEKLQAAIDAARDLARAAQAGAGTAVLDDLAGQVVQLTGAFRAELRRRTLHWRSSCPEMGWDGPACLADGGECTSDPAKVTCSKCAKRKDGRQRPC